MEDLKPDDNTPRYKKLRNILLILLAVFIVAFLVLFNLHRTFTFFAALIIWFLILIDIGILTGLTRKYYNWIFFFLLVIITGFYLRSQRLAPWEQLFIVGFTGLICVSFYSSYLFLRRYSHNVFLKYFGFSSSIILGIVTIGILWKIMHWPTAGIFLNVGMMLFIPFLFAFVFTLPGSNYVSWSKPDRTLFFRAVIIPMIFVYILCVVLFVLNDLMAPLMRPPITPFNMFPIDLLDKTGL